jgi:hypothetical protein
MQVLVRHDTKKAGGMHKYKRNEVQPQSNQLAGRNSIAELLYFIAKSQKVLY